MQAKSFILLNDVPSIGKVLTFLINKLHNMYLTVTTPPLVSKVFVESRLAPGKKMDDFWGGGRSQEHTLGLIGFRIPH